MKAAEFDYQRVGSIEEACRALDGAAGDGRIIAGGQTLVPLMVMRLARPALLVDINHVEALAGIEDGGDSVTIRAVTRQARVLASGLVDDKVPLLAHAIRFVGHGQTRNRGTVGGSLAHADPSAEIPLVAVTLNAEITAVKTGAERTIRAADFFAGPMSTALEAEECLTGVKFPVWTGAATGAGFTEINVRSSDFAIVAAAVQLLVDESGICRRAAVALGGVAPTPLRIEATAEALLSTELDAKTVGEAARLAANEIDPGADVHASAEYRRRTARVMVERAIIEARDEASMRGAKP